jgi:hypothetical protein
MCVCLAAMKREFQEQLENLQKTAQQREELKRQFQNENAALAQKLKVHITFS